MLSLKGLIIIIILSLLCTFVANADSQGPAPSIGEEGNPPQIHSPRIQQKAESDKREAEQSPLINKIINSPKTYAEANQERKDQNEKASQDWWIVRFTGAIAAIALCQFLALIAQVIAMAYQAKRLRETVSQMQVSEERQLRAYVGISSIAIANVANPLPPTDGQSGPQTPAALTRDCGPIAFVEIKNTGQTPAYNVLHGTGIGIHEFPLQDSLSMGEPSGHITKGVLPVGATSDKTIIDDDLLTLQEIEQLRAGTAKIYVYGVIIYEDVFKKVRHTYYRYMHPSVDNIIGVSTRLTVCDEGNEAD